MVLSLGPAVLVLFFTSVHSLLFKLCKLLIREIVGGRYCYLQ